MELLLLNLKINLNTCDGGGGEVCGFFSGPGGQGL